MTPEEIEEFEAGLREQDRERDRRLRYHRRAACADEIRAHRTEIVIGVALLVGFIAFMVTWNGCIQPVMERAAYNEGYYGVDRETAVAMAREGYGKTAEEILKEVR